MYYEIEGAGPPLVYIPPAFAFAGLKSFPALVQSHSVITVDLHGHGRTADLPDRPLTIEQHAEDVAGLLRHLGIAKVDFFGESYGGAIATMIAVRHPELVRRIATYGATFGPLDIAHNPACYASNNRLRRTPEASAFRRRITGEWLPILITGPRFGLKRPAFNGTDL
jgi:pimeloyl-ACP methyl ester carboxylesterase